MLLLIISQRGTYNWGYKKSEEVAKSLLKRLENILLGRVKELKKDNICVDLNNKRETVLDICKHRKVAKYCCKISEKLYWAPSYLEQITIPLSTCILESSPNGLYKTKSKNLYKSLRFSLTLTSYTQYWFAFDCRVTYSDDRTCDKYGKS